MLSLAPGSYWSDLEPRPMRMWCEPCGSPDFGPRPLRHPAPGALDPTVVGHRGALCTGILTHLLPAAQGSSRLPVLGHLPRILSPRGSHYPLRCSFPQNNSNQAFVGVCVFHVVRYMARASEVRSLWSLPGQWPEDLRPWQHFPEHPSTTLPLLPLPGPAHYPSAISHWSARIPKCQPYCPCGQ